MKRKLKRKLKWLALIVYGSFVVSIISILSIGASAASIDGDWGTFSQLSGGVTRNFKASNRVVASGDYAGAGMQVQCTNNTLPAGRIDLQPRLYRYVAPNTMYFEQSASRLENTYANQNVSYWAQNSVTKYLPNYKGERFVAWGRVWAFNQYGLYTEHTSSVLNTPAITL